jgi:hypothetical protein
MLHLWQGEAWRLVHMNRLMTQVFYEPWFEGVANHLDSGDLTNFRSKAVMEPLRKHNRER